MSIPEDGVGQFTEMPDNAVKPCMIRAPVIPVRASIASGRISTLRNSIGWLSAWSEIVPPSSILSPFLINFRRRRLCRRAGPFRIR